MNSKSLVTRRNMTEENDLEDILTQVRIEVKEQYGKVNLAEIERRTGVTRARLKRWKDNGYHVIRNKKSGRHTGSKKLAPYTKVFDDLLAKGVTNSEVLYDRLKEKGYTGGKTIIKDYISSHLDLVPARRVIVAPRSSNGMRYYTEAGDCYQMDWGFVNVEDVYGNKWRCACFAMICHHCGFRYIEFFPNAKQEQLFIGMIHAFMVMGIPKRVLTDNMKSVVIKRDATGVPIWNKEYDAFQHFIGFKTDLCKVAHPFTKGAVERLVQYVKTNFIVGRTFTNITDLNKQAWQWCANANRKQMKDYDFITSEEHRMACMQQPLPFDESLLDYLAPKRKVSFDGFVDYEGRRYGIPHAYGKRYARVYRDVDVLRILDIDTRRELQVHPVDWARAAKIAPNQWASDAEYLEQPEEHPTATVSVTMRMAEETKQIDRFSRFSFEGDM